MQEYGLKIFNIGMGLFILAMLMSIRSLQACRKNRLEWMFCFGDFREVFKDTPNIKEPYEENKFLNRAKKVYYYFECIVWFALNASIWVSIALVVIGSFLVLI